MERKLDEIRYNRLKKKIEQNLEEIATTNEREELRPNKRSNTVSKKINKENKQKANLIYLMEKQQTEDPKLKSRSVKFQ